MEAWTGATWAMDVPLERQRRTVSTAGDSQAAVGSKEALLQGKENPCSPVLHRIRWAARPLSTTAVAAEREVHRALHRAVERSVRRYRCSGSAASAGARHPPRPRLPGGVRLPRPPRPRHLGGSASRILRGLGAVRLRLGGLRGLCLGLGGLHRGQLLLGRQLASLGDDERLHVDRDVLEDLDRNRVAADPADRLRPIFFRSTRILRVRQSSSAMSVVVTEPKSAPVGP